MSKKPLDLDIKTRKNPRATIVMIFVTISISLLIFTHIITSYEYKLCKFCRENNYTGVYTGDIILNCSEYREYCLMRYSKSVEYDEWLFKLAFKDVFKEGENGKK